MPEEIRKLLSGLRWWIRGYVWLEGLAVAVAWVGLTFWLALALDYLPVLVGAGEMPRFARMILLVAIAAVLAWILYRWVLCRTFVSLADRSMALLLERRYERFRDSLITSVEMAGTLETASELNRRLLSQTQEEARGHIPHVRIRGVFNPRPLATSLVGSGTVLATIGLLYVVNAGALEMGVRRLYLLRDEPWPRNARIEVVGVEVPGAFAANSSAASSLVRFRDRRVKVARGSAVRLVVQADAAARVIPETCTVSYRTADGDQGRVRMTRVGRIRSGRQSYHYGAKPLKDILATVKFDVLGFDHRVPEHVIEVVDRPAVVECQLECVFPSYLVDETLSLWLPRTVPLTAGTQLPQGTRVTLRGATNKDLQAVSISSHDTGEAPRATITGEGESRRAFRLPIPRLMQNVSLDIALSDSDGIVSERPYRVYIGALADQAPVIDVTLAGVGTAVTPDVAIPIRGGIRDDYGLRRAWIEVAVNDSSAREEAISVGPRGEVDARIDFRDQRSREGGMVLQPKDKLTLVVKAADKYDLGTAANVGAGDHYQWDVVTPDVLLAMLEAREIGLRQRFEQIIEETTETRDMLVRVKAEGPGTVAPGGEPGEAAAGEKPAAGPADKSTETARERVWSVRLLRAQQALLQSQKSSQETLGIAAAFRDIREELVNNRIDTEDRKRRLDMQLAGPLERIGNELFPELDRRVQRLVDRLDGHLETLGRLTEDDRETVAAAETAVAQASEILLAMHQVLSDMLNLESYNELLDIVRGMIGDQQRLMEKTKSQQKKQVLELLQ